MTRFIVFDWDGTLIDSVGRIVRCFNESFQALELPPVAEEEIKCLIGLPLTESYFKLVPKGSGVSQEQFIGAYRDIWRDVVRLPLSPLFEGVPELLVELRDRGYVMAIATGKSREGLERELNHYDLSGYFQATRCANETLPKPNPEMLAQLLEECGFQAEEAVMLGDTTLDLEMANNAGIRAIGVTSGSQNEQVLLGCQPHAVLPLVTGMTSLL